MSTIGQTASSPTGDYLMQAYISNVDQSVRILHKPTLLKQLNHFRRGLLCDPQEFQCQLATVYCLALLSLSEQDCQLYLGQPRVTLIARFRGEVERLILVLNITRTHRLSALQTLILHIVGYFQAVGLHEWTMC